MAASDSTPETYRRYSCYWQIRGRALAVLCSFSAPDASFCLEQRLLHFVGGGCWLVFFDRSSVFMPLPPPEPPPPDILEMRGSRTLRADWSRQSWSASRRT